VVDSATHVPLPNVSVCAQNISRCVLTNNDGKFRMVLGKEVHRVIFTATGYHSYTLLVNDASELQATILMSKAYATLEEVVVNARKKKYHNKNNPAVELIRQVIANKAKNGPGAYPFTSYRRYEKTRMLVDKPPKFLTNSWPFKKFRFVFENLDTISIPGKKLSAVYMQEELSAVYYRRQPEKKKEVVLAKKSVDYGEYADMQGIRSAVKRLYEDINIYDNSISAFTMQFISPVADLAPTFYMYFISDTIEENGIKLIKLYFTPRSKEDLFFQGYLYITMDGNYAVRKLEMTINKNANLNWVRNVQVTQDFEKGPGDRYHLATSDVLAFFSPFVKSGGLFGERTISISHLTDSVIADSVFKGPQEDTLALASVQPDSVWDEGRTIPLSGSEAKAYANTDSLVKMRSYHRLMDFATLLSVGYKSAGPFDIGQIGNFYSFNPLEGSRVRFGGRSNTRFSKSIFLESYIAYGFRDQQWKYLLSGAYSFNHKSIYTFPFHYVQASFMHDTRNPGQESVFSQGNAFLSSFTRGYNSKWLYNDIFRLTYVRETGSHITYTIGMKYWKQQPADSLYYIYQPADTATQLTVSELSLSLRWAPHEQFFQNKVTRTNIVNKYPIITFQYAKGISGVLGGQYNYDAFHLDIFKRFYIAPFGFTDVTFDAGYLGGNLPFPLLVIHPANQSYFYSYFSYNLMNTEEFVSDHYAGVNLDHYFNGLFFNKIPLLKKLRLREVIAAKILYGGLRDENNPATNPTQMKFPLLNGKLSTYELGSVPYVEASVGIYNIFSIIRLDLVKRFTYLNHPDISTLGLRFSTNFSF